MNDKIDVLLVDDEEEFLVALTPALERRGMRIATAGNGRLALDALGKTEFDVVVLDLNMPLMGGMETLKELKGAYPLVEVVVLTGHGSMQTAVEAIKLGAFDFQEKPADVDQLTAKIREAFDHKLGKTTEEYRRRMEELLKLRWD